jgi:hypothetical protein
MTPTVGLTVRVRQQDLDCYWRYSIVGGEMVIFENGIWRTGA